jgi:hypothetical protein
MQTSVHLYQYFTSDKVVERTKAQNTISLNFYQKSCSLLDVKKYGRARQGTGDR